MEPNDVDCALLVGTDFPKDVGAEDELLDGLPFLHIALADQDDFDVFVGDTFATDRVGTSKGMIEVIR